MQIEFYLSICHQNRHLTSVVDKFLEYKMPAVDINKLAWKECKNHPLLITFHNSFKLICMMWWRCRLAFVTSSILVADSWTSTKQRTIFLSASWQRSQTHSELHKSIVFVSWYRFLPFIFLFVETWSINLKFRFSIFFLHNSERVFLSRIPKISRPKKSDSQSEMQ